MNELFSQKVSSKEIAHDANQDALWPEMEKPTNLTVGYRVLARKYRPSTFDQLIGQEAMVRTLTNAINSGRLPHAWMLTGVRGIGKTTTARIIARALNCTGPDSKGGPTIKPCGVCDACKSIAEDRHVDVLEMDAASRTGVDDIREIIDGVRYGPVSARYKVYILDEVHMLTKNAFNALLKTLEEPPPHTKFIFATTEIRKVPVTVLSRCQRFDLRRIDNETLIKHFTEVLALEKVTNDEEAVRMIAQAADGSVRDGLSLLDQAIALGNGSVTQETVKDMLGLVDRGHSMALCRDILQGSMKSALDTFSMMQQAGSDPLQVLQDLSELIHLLTRGQVIPDYAKLASLPEYDRQLLSELSAIKIPALTRAWQILLKGIGEVQTAPHPAQAAEMVLIRLSYAAELPLPADLIKQLREQGISPSNMQKPPSPAAEMGGGGTSAVKVRRAGGPGLANAIAENALPQSNPSIENLPRSYKEVVELFLVNREAALYGHLYNSAHVVRCEPGILEINVEDAVPPNIVARLSQCLSEWTKHRWMVSLSDRPGQPTLLEDERREDKKRNDQAMADPLMTAVMATFPGAKLTALRHKVVATLTTKENDATSLNSLEDPSETQILEDET